MFFVVPYHVCSTIQPLIFSGTQAHKTTLSVSGKAPSILPRAFSSSSSSANLLLMESNCFAEFHAYKSKDILVKSAEFTFMSKVEKVGKNRASS